MSDHTKMVSERDAVIRERKAFQHGAEHGKEYRTDSFASAAKSFYPLPKMTRPRVVRENGIGGEYEWRAVDGVIECRNVTGGSALTKWRTNDGTSASFGMFISARRVRLLADLLANPTEEVDDV